MDPARLNDCLARHLPACLEWLRRSVGINSFTSHAAGVDAVGDLTAEMFAPLGFSAERAASEHPGYGHHLFLTRPASQPDAPRLLLVTHLDTVFPPEEEEAQDFRWRPEPAEGRIYGPGTVDIKGGTALIWLMLQGLHDSARDLFDSVNWIIAANASEEVMAKDFADRATERCGGSADAVLVFEGGPRTPEGWHVVQARKGRAVYRITATGRAAHAGSAHDQGVNAIVGLAGVIPSIARLTSYENDLTVNVGFIEGGTVVNRVPHEARAELEMRAYDPGLLARAGVHVEALARPLDGAEAAVQVENLGTSPAWPASEANAPLVAHWIAAARELGLTALPVSRGGLSDANYLCHLGPTLDGLGPSGANAHCSERCADGGKVPEFVEPDSFVPKAAMNALAIRRLLSQPAGSRR